MFYTVEEAINDLKKGKVIIVIDNENRENEGDFLALAEFATPETVNLMAKEGKGLVCVPVDRSIATQLGLRLMTEENTDSYSTAFTVSIDHRETSTGISAYERSHTIKSMLDLNATATDFKSPGHIFPLIANDGGVLSRAGHTEAAVDLAKIAGSAPAGIICEIMNKDGSMARVKDLEEIASRLDLGILTIEELITYKKKNQNLIKREVEINLPTEFGEFRVIGYTEVLTGKEHIALVKGDISSEQPILTRIHSECLIGEVFSSDKCDCGTKLNAALLKISEEKTGVLLYLRQEGRDVGLINKLKAYDLREQGYDTVAANQKFGFTDDSHDYEIGALILKDIGLEKIKLLTNNPRDINEINNYGLEVVTQLALDMSIKKKNPSYMSIKKTLIKV